MPTEGILSDVRVLDLGTGIAAPLAGMLLAEAGADVVKIEPPEGCTTPTDGRAYIRLISGLAFAVPTDGLFLPFPEEHGTSETVPLGCPENPIKEYYFKFSLFHTDIQPVLTDNGHYGYQLTGNNVIVSSHEWRLQRFAEVAAEFANCEKTVEGITLCRTCRRDLARPTYCTGDINGDKHVGGVAVALVDSDNLTPGGLPWAASCMPTHVASRWFCRAGYNLVDGLSLSYEFGSKGPKLDNLRAIDLGIRVEALKLRVPELDGPVLRR